MHDVLIDCDAARQVIPDLGYEWSDHQLRSLGLEVQALYPELASWTPYLAAEAQLFYARRHHGVSVTPKIRAEEFLVFLRTFLEGRVQPVAQGRPCQTESAPALEAAREVAAPLPMVVVLPARLPPTVAVAGTMIHTAADAKWNACLDELERLNVRAFSEGLLLRDGISEARQAVTEQTQTSPAGEVGDLVALVGRLARKLSKAAPDDPLSEQAVEFLRRKRLVNPLRSCTPAGAEAHLPAAPSEEA
ncbi:TPA: hypothetical protein ACGW3W_002225 [Pseudomonas aeruginosa]